MGRKRAELFRVLGVESRIRIIELLKKRGPMCVNELSDSLGISASAVSQHLKTLKYAGLVRNERNGYWIHYEVEPKALERCGGLLSTVCTCDCCDTDESVDVKPGDSRDSVALLKEYEKELRAELEAVRTRIRELKKED